MSNNMEKYQAKQSLNEQIDELKRKLALLSEFIKPD